MNTVFIDESGYTGRDLLNPMQPFMSLSALFVSQQEAIKLRSKHFAGVKADELKHSSLSRRAAYFDSLLSIQEDCLRNCKGISYIVNKRYMCILKMLDVCVEPAYHELGIDFYDNGGHQALASLIYATAPVFWGKEKFDELLRLYQEASKNKTHECIDALCNHVRQLDGLEVAETLAPIAKKHPLFVEEIQSAHTSTDITFSLMYGLVSKLEECSGGQYEIIHDCSPAMRKYHGLLKVMMDDTTECVFRVSDLCRISYPLQLSQVREADSKSECGLQLADILAGGVISGARTAAGIDKGNAYSECVLNNYSDHNLLFMLPNTDFQEIRQQFTGNQISKAIDHVARRAAELDLGER